MEKIEPMKVLHLDCACMSSEHILRYIYDEDEKNLYTEVQLRQYRNIFKRIWIAIKYIFGYTSRYGVWDCTLLEREGRLKLYSFLGKLNRAEKK